MFSRKYSLICSLMMVTKVISNTWLDANGFSCEDYKSKGYCLNGSYGPKWRYDVEGQFQDHADENGFDAGDKCCECIPSTSHVFIILNCPVRTEPDNDLTWYDSSGLTCQFYRDEGWCERFGYGNVFSNANCIYLLHLVSSFGMNRAWKSVSFIPLFLLSNSHTFSTNRIFYYLVHHRPQLAWRREFRIS